MRSFRKMMRSYGFGCGEAQMGFEQFWRWLVSLIPPLILFTKRQLRDLPFQYLMRAAWVRGFIEGRLFGHKPPPGWQRINGVWISPQAIATVAARQKPQYAQLSGRP
jgi:hypothetical protein